MILKNGFCLGYILTGRPVQGVPWSAHSKMVRYVLLRPLRPELDGQDVEILIVLFLLNSPDGQEFTFSPTVQGSDFVVLFLKDFWKNKTEICLYVTVGPKC
jgi:hypothetical protein